MPNELDDFDDDARPGVQPHRGVMILVLGILGLMMCGILAIIAWVLGKRDLDLMRRGLMDREGEGLTKAGYILGIVGTIILCIQLVVVVAYIALAAVWVAGR